MRGPDHVLARDQEDPLRECRSLFDLPESLIYLDGNSLGPLPKGVAERVAETVRVEWGQSLIAAWNRHDWIGYPERVGNRLAPLVGAPEDTVTLTDTLSLNVVKALSAALDLRPGRSVVLSDTGNFPSDLYMAEGLLSALGRGHSLRLVEPEQVEEAIDERVAAVMLTEVDYRTGRLHDMRRVTAAAHEAGALSLWDLAHSAGALPVALERCGVDMAFGCTYKYLNGGPGAPGFIYLRPGLAEQIRPLLCGWLGHERPFDFSPHYQPSPGIRRMRVGTPPVLALAALDAALDVWEGVDLELVRRKSAALGDLFIAEVERLCGTDRLQLASPRAAAERGSQVSFRCEEGYAVMQALIDHGVVGDFRAPDHLRFGFAPLYLRYADVAAAAEIFARILREQRYLQPKYQRRAEVT